MPKPREHNSHPSTSDGDELRAGRPRAGQARHRRFGAIPTRILWMTLAAGGLMVVGCIVVLALHNYRWKHIYLTTLPPRSPTAAKGVLSLSLYGDKARNHNPTLHESVFVKGRDYSGMEDNDLRGFLDGEFTHWWTMPTFNHVRIGRRSDNPGYGEFELFRALHRWSDITLPAGAVVSGARLSQALDQGSRVPVNVFLYPVKRDWDPGEGGIDRDSSSPPNKGEVWWREVASEGETWGLPGAGFASDDHPEADTSAMPLASSLHRPGETHLSFSSEPLTRYAEARVRDGKPLLLLQKMADYEEDMTGSETSFYSANFGSDRSVASRPHLFLKWSSRTETQSIRRDVFIEYGRSYILPRIALRGDEKYLAVSFAPAAEFETPTISVRGADERGPTPWRRVALPLALPSWRWIEVRLTAAVDPVELGNGFEAELLKPWVRNGPPETQSIPWTFISPTGAIHRVEASYVGDLRWRVAFRPREPGRWRYSWSHTLAESFQSEEHIFDVVAGSKEAVHKELQAFLEDVRREAKLNLYGDRRTRLYGTRFNRLERAAMQLETPESFASEDGRALRALLNETREELGGEAVPSTVSEHHY